MLISNGKPVLGLCTIGIRGVINKLLGRDSMPFDAK
jgi:hypothetical protein